MSLFHMTTDEASAKAAAAIDATAVKEVDADYLVRAGFGEGSRAWIVETFRGCVISEREMNGYDDSDFYAMVWDESLGKFREIEYATTRGWTYLNGCTIDATPEVAARWEALKAAQAARFRELQAAFEAKLPKVGREVRVVKGRKVPVGTSGRVFWTGASRFGERVGIETVSGDRVFLAASNVEVMNGEPALVAGSSSSSGEMEAQAVAS